MVKNIRWKNWKKQCLHSIVANARVNSVSIEFHTVLVLVRINKLKILLKNIGK